jgi:hypothetical protein
MSLAKGNLATNSKVLECHLDDKRELWGIVRGIIETLGILEFALRHGGGVLMTETLNKTLGETLGNYFIINYIFTKSFHTLPAVHGGFFLFKNFLKGYVVIY